MIVDTSAVVAIIKAEPDWERYERTIEQGPSVKLSAANYVEAGLVADRAGHPRFSRLLDSVINNLGIETVALTPAQAKLARRAYREFGKGSGHPAQLNFGDCFAYALAIETDEPLLFKGEDFVHTDVRVAASS